MINKLKILFCSNFLDYDISGIMSDHLGRWIIEPMRQANKDFEIKSLLFGKMDVSKVFNANKMGLIHLTHKDYELFYTDGVLSSNINKQLLGWTPNCIIFYSFSKPNLIKRLYPNILCLYYENGIFSRPPFPRTLYFDPLGYDKSFLNTHITKLQNYKITRLQDLRKRLWL